MRSIKVKDCMTKKVVTLSPDIQIIEAIRILLQHDITAAPVLDGEGALIGILSETDCLQGTLISSYYSEGGGVVREHMTADVKSVSSEDDIISTYQHFMTHRAFRIPVMENDVVVGMLSPKDLMSAVLEFFERPAENQPHTDHI